MNTNICKIGSYTWQVKDGTKVMGIISKRMNSYVSSLSINSEHGRMQLGVFDNMEDAKKAIIDNF